MTTIELLDTCVTQVSRTTHLFSPYTTEQAARLVLELSTSDWYRSQAERCLKGRPPVLAEFETHKQALLLDSNWDRLDLKARRRYRRAENLTRDRLVNWRTPG